MSQIPVAVILILIVSVILQTIDARNGAEEYLDEKENIATDKTNKDEVEPTIQADSSGETVTQIDTEIKISNKNEETTAEPNIILTTINHSRDRRRVHFGKIRKCWGSPVFVNNSKLIHLCNQKPNKSVQKYFKVRPETSSSKTEKPFSRLSSHESKNIENLFDKFFKNMLDVNVHESTKSTPTSSENLPGRDVFVHKFFPVTHKPKSDEDIFLNKTAQVLDEIYDDEELFTTKLTIKATQKPQQRIPKPKSDDEIFLNKTAQVLDEIYDEQNDLFTTKSTLKASQKPQQRIPKPKSDDEIFLNKTAQVLDEIYDQQNELFTTKASLKASQKPQQRISKPKVTDEDIFLNKTEQVLNEIYDDENELFSTKASLRKPPQLRIPMMNKNILRTGKIQGKTLDEKLADHLLDEIADSDTDFSEDSSFKDNKYSITRQNVNNKTGERILFHEIEKDPDETDPDEKSAFEGNKYSENSDDDPFEGTSQDTIPPFDLIQTTTTTMKPKLVTPLVFPDEVDDDDDDTPLKRTTRKDKAITEASVARNRPSSDTDDDDYENEETDKADTAGAADQIHEPDKEDKDESYDELYKPPFRKLPSFDTDSDSDTNDDDSESDVLHDYHMPREKVMQFDPRPNVVREYLAKIRASGAKHINKAGRPKEATFEDVKTPRPRLLYYQQRQKPQKYLDLITGKDEYKKYYYDKDGVPRLKTPFPHKYPDKNMPIYRTKPEDRQQKKYSKTILRTRPDSIKAKYKDQATPEKKVSHLAVLPKKQTNKKPTSKSHKVAPTVLPLQKTTMPLNVINQKKKPGKKVTTTKAPKHTIKIPKPKEHVLPANVKVQPIKSTTKMENQTRIIPLKKKITPNDTSEAKLVNKSHIMDKDKLKIVPKTLKTQSIVETILNALLNKTKLLNETTLNIAKTHKLNATVERRTIAVFKNLIQTILKVLEDKSGKSTNKTWYNVTHPSSKDNKTGLPPDSDDGGKRIIPLLLPDNAASLFDKTFLRNSFKGNVSAMNITHPAVPAPTHEVDLHPPYTDDDMEETFENEPIFTEPEVYSPNVYKIPKNLVETVLNIVLDKNLYLNDSSNKTHPYKNKEISKSSPIYKSIVETVLNKYLNNKTEIESLINTTQKFDLFARINSSIEQDAEDTQKRLSNETSIDSRPFKKITKEKMRLDSASLARQTTKPGKSVAISILNKFLASNASTAIIPHKKTSTNATPPAIIPKATQIPLATPTSIDVKVTKPTKMELNKTSSTLKILPITDSYQASDVVNLSETELLSTKSLPDKKESRKVTEAMETRGTTQKVKTAPDIVTEATPLTVVELNRSMAADKAVLDMSGNKNLEIPEVSLNNKDESTTILNVLLLPVEENEPTDTVNERTINTKQTVNETTDTSVIPYTDHTLSTESNLSTSKKTSTTESSVLITEPSTTEMPKTVITTEPSAPVVIVIKKKEPYKKVKTTDNISLKAVPTKITKQFKDISDVRTKAENVKKIENKIGQKPKMKMHSAFPNKTLPIYDTMLTKEKWHQIPTHATMYLKKTLPPLAFLKKTTVKEKEHIDEKLTGKEMSYPVTIASYLPSTVATILNKTELKAESYKDLEPPASKAELETVHVPSKNNLTVSTVPSQQTKTLTTKAKNNIPKATTKIVTKATTASTNKKKANEMLTNKILKESGTSRESTMPLKERGTPQSKEKVTKKPVAKTKITQYITRFLPKVTSTLSTVNKITKASKKIQTTKTSKKTTLAAVNTTSKSLKKDSATKQGQTKVNIKLVMEKIKQGTLLPFTMVPTRAGSKKTYVPRVEIDHRVKQTRISPTKTTKVTKKTTLTRKNLPFSKTKTTKSPSVKATSKKQSNTVTVQKVLKKSKLKNVTSHVLPTLNPTLPYLKKHMQTSLQTVTRPKVMTTRVTKTTASVEKYKTQFKGLFRDDMLLTEDYDVFEDSTPMTRGTTYEDIIDKLLRTNVSRWQVPLNETLEEDDEYYDDEDDTTTTSVTLPYTVSKKLYGSYVSNTPQEDESTSTVTTIADIPSVGGTDDLIQSTSSYLTRKFYEYDKSLPPVPVNTTVETVPYTYTTPVERLPFISKALTTQSTLPTSWKEEDKVPDINVLPLVPPTTDDRLINVIGLTTISDESVTPTSSNIRSRSPPLSSTVKPFSTRKIIKPVKSKAVLSTAKTTTTASPETTLVETEPQTDPVVKTSPVTTEQAVQKVKKPKPKLKTVSHLVLPMLKTTLPETDATTIDTTTLEPEVHTKEAIPESTNKIELDQNEIDKHVPVEMTTAQDINYDEQKQSDKEEISKIIQTYEETSSSPPVNSVEPTEESSTPVIHVATFSTDFVSTVANVEQVNEVLNKAPPPAYGAESTDDNFPMNEQFATAPISEIVSIIEGTSKPAEILQETTETDATTSSTTVVHTTTLRPSTMPSYDYQALVELESVPSIAPLPETESTTVSTTTSEPERLTKEVVPVESTNKIEVPTSSMLYLEEDTPPVVDALTTSGVYVPEPTFPSPDILIDKPWFANATAVTLPEETPTNETKFDTKVTNATIPMNITVIAIGSLPISNGTKVDNTKYAYTVSNDNMDAAANQKLDEQTAEYARMLANFTYPNITSFTSKLDFNKTILENYLYKLLSENETCVNKTNSVDDVHLNITLAIARKHLNETVFTNDTLRRIANNKNIKSYNIFNMPYEKGEDKKTDDINLKKLALAIYVNRSVPAPVMYPVITPLPDFTDLVDDVELEGTFYSDMAAPESYTNEVRPPAQPVLQPTLHIVETPTATTITSNVTTKVTLDKTVESNEKPAPTEREYTEDIDRLSEDTNTKITEKKASESTTTQMDSTDPITEYLPTNMTSLSDVYTKIAFPTIKSNTKPMSISETYWKHLLESEINKRKQVPIMQEYPRQSTKPYPTDTSQINIQEREQIPIVQSYPVDNVQLFKRIDLDPDLQSWLAKYNNSDTKFEKEGSKPTKYKLPIDIIPNPTEQKPVETVPPASATYDAPVFPKPETLRPDMTNSTYQPKLIPAELVQYPKTDTTEAPILDIPTTKTYIQEYESKFMKSTTDSNEAQQKAEYEKVRYEAGKRLHIDTCGIDNSPSSGGEEGPQRIEKYPWLGVLIYPRGKQRLVTTVVLVTVQLVVASALDIEKLPKKDLRTCARVVLGANCTGPRIRVVNYNYHPDFRAGMASAIALIQINTDLVAYKLRPICGPPKQFVEPQFFAMVMPNDCRSSKITLYAMDYVPTDTCKEYYMHAGLDVTKMWPAHTACGRARWGGQCTWRTGTLLVVRQQYRWHLVGFGVRGPGCEAPSRFVDFAMYYDWVTTTVARIGQPAITRIAPNHLILRRSINELQKFGPCDASEVSSEIFTDTTTFTPPKEKLQVGMARYNLTILANVDYHCVVFSARNLRGVEQELPRLELRRYCRGPPAYCFSGPGIIQIDFFVTIYFFLPIEYKVAAYGQLAKIVDPKLLTQYVNKRYSYPPVPFWEMAVEGSNITLPNKTSNTRRTLKSRKTFLTNYRNSPKYKYDRRMGRLSRLKALDQRRLEMLRRIAEEKRRNETEEERRNNITYIETSREFI